jgi:hypothetical protein
MPTTGASSLATRGLGRIKCATRISHGRPLRISLTKIFFRGKSRKTKEGGESRPPSGRPRLPDTRPVGPPRPRPRPPARRPPSADRGARPGAALRPALRRIGRTPVSGAQPPGPGGAKAEGQEEVPDTPPPNGRKRPCWSVDWNFVPVGQGRRRGGAPPLHRPAGMARGRGRQPWRGSSLSPCLSVRRGRDEGRGPGRSSASGAAPGCGLSAPPEARPPEGAEEGTGWARDEERPRGARGR